jgi:hypothetical protein
MPYGFADLMDCGLPAAFRFDLDLDSSEEIIAQHHSVSDND